MSTTPTQRRERKRQRRRRRLAQRGPAPAPRLADADDPRDQVRLEIAVPMPVGPGPDVPRGAPPTQLSDALMQLMQPYLQWPPAPDELDDFLADLRFGAAVWNATVVSVDPTKCALALDQVARDYGVPRAHVQLIATRKQRRFPTDTRHVVDVTLTTEGGRAVVWATSTLWVSAARTPSSVGEVGGAQ